MSDVIPARVRLPLQIGTSWSDGATSRRFAMSAADEGASFPPETFHELVGRLTLPLWGLTPLAR
jgi:hypothetical protein